MRNAYRNHTYKAIENAFAMFGRHWFAELSALNDEYEVKKGSEESYIFTKQLCETFGILKIKNDKIYSTRIQDLELYLVNELLRMWVANDFIKWAVADFQNNWTRNELNDWTLFYVFMVFRKATVNIYVYDDDVVIKTAYEHDGFTQQHSYHKNHFVVNLNTYLSTQYKEDYISTLDKKYYLSASERALVADIRDDQYQKDEIIVRIKQNKIKSFDVFGREYDLSLLAELKKKIQYGNIWTEQHEWWAEFITIKEKKRFS